VEAILMTAREIAAGMSYLHGDNILHGDLTAGNILLLSSPKDRRQFSAKVGFARGMVQTGTLAMAGNACR
jgi:tRNA A-37 threonylcarbamoyl transferase component Bud32